MGSKCERGRGRRKMRGGGAERRGREERRNSRRHSLTKITKKMEARPREITHLAKSLLHTGDPQSRSTEPKERTNKQTNKQNNNNKKIPLLYLFF